MSLANIEFGKIPSIASHPGHFQIFNLETLSNLINKFPFQIMLISGIHQRLHFVENIWPSFTCDTLICEFRKEKEDWKMLNMIQSEENLGVYTSRDGVLY